MAVFDGGYDHIQGRQFAFQLEPGFPAAARRVCGFRIFDHEAFVATGLRGFEELIEFLRCGSAKRRGADDRGGYFVFFRGVERQTGLRASGICFHGIARSGENGVKNSRPLAQRFINEQVASGIQNVEDEVGNRDVAHHLLADFFPAEAAGESAERLGAAGIAGLGSQTAPGYNFAVEDRVVGKACQGFGQFGE